jgi:hypothetical protein
MSQATERTAEHVPALADFSGTPARYRRLAALFSIAIHAYLYAGMVLIEYGIRGESWIFGSKPIGLTLASALVFAWHMNRSILYLDARHGRGSRWILNSKTVKLPEHCP